MFGTWKYIYIFDTTRWLTSIEQRCLVSLEPLSKTRDFSICLFEPPCNAMSAAKRSQLTRASLRYEDKKKSSLIRTEYPKEGEKTLVVHRLVLSVRWECRKCGDFCVIYATMRITRCQAPNAQNQSQDGALTVSNPFVDIESPRRRLWSQTRESGIWDMVVCTLGIRS